MASRRTKNGILIVIIILLILALVFFPRLYIEIGLGTALVLGIFLIVISVP